MSETTILIFLYLLVGLGVVFEVGDATPWERLWLGLLWPFVLGFVIGNGAKRVRKSNLAGRELN